MQQRYKVLWPYPNSVWEVGDILTPLYDNSVWFGIPDKDEYDGCVIHENWIKKCTNIFDPLPWFVEREIEDMPKYLKCEGAYGTLVYPAEFIMKEENGWTVKVGRTIIPHGNYLKDKFPATDQEYQEYIKTLNNRPKYTR